MDPLVSWFRWPAHVSWALRKEELQRTTDVAVWLHRASSEQLKLAGFGDTAALTKVQQRLLGERIANMFRDDNQRAALGEFFSTEQAWPFE